MRRKHGHVITGSYPAGFGLQPCLCLQHLLPGRRVGSGVTRVERDHSFAMMAAAHRRVNHLWSAGSTYHGAHLVLVWLSRSE